MMLASNSKAASFTHMQVYRGLVCKVEKLREAYVVDLATPVTYYCSCVRPQNARYKVGTGTAYVKPETGQQH